ncbi:MAG: 3-deoxy-manno-octulosonate cytidylyltransferase [Bacteroidetes bacterium]|nr:3-deoxy-manno-octulosonate cytidylyltransferase [Bacteroidota bacterium]
MKIIGIIPARYASSRFPGKPLARITGKSMIQRVWEQASSAKCFSQVIVATDDIRIKNHVDRFGGAAIMTSSRHRTGTERIGEAIKKIPGISADDIVFNIQGDEPFVKPGSFNLLVRCFVSKEIQIATLAVKLTGSEELHNPNVPKVIINKFRDAIYFSRAPVPWCRGFEKQDWTKHHTYYQHIGIYAYRAGILRKIIKLPPSPLEIAESLEQLRWLENGYAIKVALTDHKSISVDTPEDIERAEKFLQEK